MSRARTILSHFVLVLLACQAATAATFYVATDGNDANPGTEQQPFATLERARDEIRRQKSKGPLPAGGVVVELRGGTYELPRSLELTAEDSGA